MKFRMEFITRLKPGFFIIFALIFSFFLLYHPKTTHAAGSWSTGTAGGTARNYHASEVSNGKIYSWGGGPGINITNTMNIYDIASGGWSNGQSGGTARGSHKSALYNGKIYFWSGCSESTCVNDLNTIDIYDIAGNTWSTGLAGGTGRSFASSALYNGKIYFWGGRENNVNVLNTMDIYNIAGNSWTTGLAGGTARQSHTAVASNGKIYSWGGCGDIDCWDTLNTIDIYDIAGNSWSTGLAGGTPRSSHTSVLYDGKIYSWGGWDASANLLNSIDIYDIAGNTWSTGTAGGTARFAHSSVLSDDKIYSWGGIVDPNWDDTNIVDIYDIDYQPAATPAPASSNNFTTLPDDNRPVNLDEGGVISDPVYTIEVKPSSKGILKVEFFVDDNLICTDTSADANGVYSCDWDTTKYHSSIKIIAYYLNGQKITLTRNVEVEVASDQVSDQISILPETGASQFDLPSRESVLSIAILFLNGSIDVIPLVYN